MTKVHVCVTLPRELYDRWKQRLEDLTLSKLLEDALRQELDRYKKQF